MHCLDESILKIN